MSCAYSVSSFIVHPVASSMFFRTPSTVVRLNIRAFKKSTSAESEVILVLYEYDCSVGDEEGKELEEFICPESGVAGHI
jgi:hypothetical protein